MFTGQKIDDLVKLLERREVVLYHSCQYVDFLSYISLGGIPSRKTLISGKKGFTKFDSDVADQNNEVWDKVFLNMHDFGQMFARGNGIPTVYGPIHFVISPKALLASEDVALSLRSAGCEGFDRNKESLDTIEDVIRIFMYGSNAESRLLKELKGRRKLQVEFKQLSISNPEISISCKNGMLSFQDVKYLKIDPYLIDGVSLKNHVISTKKFAGNVYDRNFYGDAIKVFDDLNRLLLIKEISLDELMKNESISPETRQWVIKLRQIPSDLDKQWRTYSKYLREGTLLPILEGTYVKNQ